MKRSKKYNNIKIREIDKKVRRAFGKFYIFSGALILFLLVFPFIMERVKKWFDIILLIFFLIFYTYMIRDLYKNKENYWTTLTSIFIFLFIIIMTLDVIKIVFFLIK